ncbi:hypothetical protein vBAspALolek_23 [Aeromonas phage vB_AspA_Lolek]|nr:hypothetical protein vBAspALolek_23 [Aeromonas phage vB_AspA_Lolek]
MKPRYGKPRFPNMHIIQHLEEYSFKTRTGEAVLHECPQGWAAMGMPRTKRNMWKVSRHFRFSLGIA